MRKEQTVEEIFSDDLKRLREFTAACRPDMHEPDEQGITAVFGPSQRRSGLGIYAVSLDNACTGEDGDLGFWLKSEEGQSEWFNLADIIALARRA